MCLVNLKIKLFYSVNVLTSRAPLKSCVGKLEVYDKKSPFQNAFEIIKNGMRFCLQFYDVKKIWYFVTIILC